MITKDWEWTDNICKFFIVLENDKIEEKYLHRGPSLEMTDAVEQFKLANKTKGKFSNIDGFIFVELKRNYTDANKAIDAILKEDYVKERIKSAKIN